MLSSACDLLELLARHRYDWPPMQVYVSLARRNFDRMRTHAVEASGPSSRSREQMNNRSRITSHARPLRKKFSSIGILCLNLASVSASGASVSNNSPFGVPHPINTMNFTLAANGGNCNGCEWIAAEGPITQDTPRDFETFLKNSGDGLDGRETVRLNSEGGNLIAGLELGEAIRAHKMATEVGRTASDSGDPRWQETESGSCYSACAYAFLGGVKRLARVGELGFHQFYPSGSVTEAIKQGDLDKTMSSAQQVMGLLVIYLKEMSIDPALLFLASSADPSALFRPDTDMMFKLGITNMRETPLFSGWTIEPYRAGAVVTGKLSGGFNEDQQITFFCRSNLPRKVLMLASWQYASATPSQAADDDQSLRTAILGSSVAVGGRVMRQASGYDSIADSHVDKADRWFLTYVLSSDEFAAGLKSDRLEVKIDGPHSLGSFGFSFSPPTAGLDRAARIAFRSCL
jgi:hypothetical protein